MKKGAVCTLQSICQMRCQRSANFLKAYKFLLNGLLLSSLLYSVSYGENHVREGEDWSEVRPSRPVEERDPYPDKPRNITISSDDERTPNVPMMHYLINQEKHYTTLQTSSVATCIAVTMYDPKTKTGLVAHLSGRTKLVGMDVLFAEFKHLGIDLARLEIGMVGGWKDFSEPLAALFEEALKNHNISKENIRYRYLFKAGVPTLAVNLDLSNGHVTLYEESVGVREAEINPDYAYYDKYQAHYDLIGGLYRRGRSMQTGLAVPQYPRPRTYKEDVWIRD